MPDFVVSSRHVMPDFVISSRHVMFHPASLPTFKVRPPSAGARRSRTPTKPHREFPLGSRTKMASIRPRDAVIGRTHGPVAVCSPDPRQHEGMPLSSLLQLSPRTGGTWNAVQAVGDASANGATSNASHR